MYGFKWTIGLCLVLNILVCTETGSTRPQGQSTVRDEDAPWAQLRAAVDQHYPVYRPTILPARFGQMTPVFVDGTFLGVSYLRSTADYLQFTVGGANSAAPHSSEPITVHGFPGLLTFSDGVPPIGVSWQESGQSYSIRGGQAITRTEILQVAENLAAIGVDGDFAPQCFAATGTCLRGRFFSYWHSHGGLTVNGYPISDEFDQQLEDGQTYRVQYFERVRLELHPNNIAPYDVLLGQFGRIIHPTDPPVAARTGYQYYSETGHNVPPDFQAFWNMHGGLAQFGYPLSEVFKERLEDGREYEVQYFERARFERHPENRPPYDILLGQFGRQILSSHLLP